MKVTCKQLFLINVTYKHMHVVDQDDTGICEQIMGFQERISAGYYSGGL